MLIGEAHIAKTDAAQCGILTLAMAALAQMRSGRTDRHLGIMFWVCGLIAFSMEFGLMGARMFASERKSKTLGALYTLPVGTGRLIRHKILGSLSQLIPSVALSLLGLLLMFNGSAHWNLRINDEFLAGLTLAVTCYIFFAVLVMYLSLRMRRAPFATGLCVMFFLYILVGFTFSSMFRHRDGTSQMFTIAGLGWIGIAVIASRIPHRIALAAADE